MLLLAFRNLESTHFLTRSLDCEPVFSTHARESTEKGCHFSLKRTMRNSYSNGSRGVKVLLGQSSGSSPICYSGSQRWAGGDLLQNSQPSAQLASPCQRCKLRFQRADP